MLDHKILPQGKIQVKSSVDVMFGICYYYNYVTLSGCSYSDMQMCCFYFDSKLNISGLWSVGRTFEGVTSSFWKS